MTNTEKVLDVITRRPGITVSEIVGEAAISEVQVWRIMGALSRDRTIVRFQRGWKVKE